MNELFALQGAADCGKSETIKSLAELLLKKYPNAKMNNLAPTTVDLKAVITGINGHIVGIESQGDPNSRLEMSLNDFMNMKCDIIFCACRTSGMTVNWINTLKNKYTIHFIQQIWTATNHNQNNQNMAQIIASLAGL